MKIDRRQTLAGWPAIKVRDFLQYLKRCGEFGAPFENLEAYGNLCPLGEEGLNRLLEAGLIEQVPPQPQEGLKCLLGAGFVEQAPPLPESPSRYRITHEGCRLALHKFVPRLARAKANQLVEQFLKRVDEVNTSSYYLMTVGEVHLFGSYITDAADLGDIDLAIKLEAKYSGTEWVAHNLARADATGRDLDYFARLSYGETEVRRFLKSRSPYISMHGVDELERNGWNSLKVRPLTSPTAAILSSATVGVSIPSR